MNYEERLILSRIIYPYLIPGNNLFQKEAFERVKKHLDTRDFRTVSAKIVWQQLEQLHAKKMPFCDLFFEFGTLDDVSNIIAPLDITPHIKLLGGKDV